MNNLKKIRTEKGLSQSEMAKLLNISPQRYSAYENNNRKFPVNLAFKLCDLFKLQLEDIFIKYI